MIASIVFNYVIGNIIHILSLHFDEIIYVRDTYNQELIDKIDLGIIFELMAERFIYKHL